MRRSLPAGGTTGGEGDQLHANAYVTKPVDFERFISVVRQIGEFFVSGVKLPPRR